MKMVGDVDADDNGVSSSIADPEQHPQIGGKELGHRTLRSLKRGLGRLWRRHRGNASITEYDPCYKVAYLGNVLTGWAKGEGCVEKPVSTLWRNYVGSTRPDVTMRLTVTNGGLTATTKDHGLTEYWAHRVTYCTAPASHPRLFVWVYRHEGRRLRPELRCHAALCSKESTAKRLAATLNTRLQQALHEFRRDKVLRQNARLSLANSVYENPSLPRRKILLSTGGQNYRPPLERSKSAPKLSAIEEDAVAEEIEQKRLFEELRSLENVTRSWQVQDGWRLARFVDALNCAAGTSGEYFDENGSISSGCETASTSNSEERAPGTNDHHSNNNNSNNNNHNNSINNDNVANGSDNNASREGNTQRAGRRVIFAEDIVRSAKSMGLGPRRNSDGSPNFITCPGYPRFHCARGIVRNRHKNAERSEDEDTMEEEEEEEETDEDVEEEEPKNVFAFEDPEDFDEVVDYRPHGESPSRLESGTGRRVEVKGEKYPSKMRQQQVDEPLIHGDAAFSTLDSLNEEEVDSDESGYVEASPKSLKEPENGTENSTVTGDDIIAGETCSKETSGLEDKKNISAKLSGISSALTDDNSISNSSDEKFLNSSDCRRQDACELLPATNMNNQKSNNWEKVDFIKCPISETIKKLANASLRSSKSFELSTATCFKALNNLKSSKSFENSTKNPAEQILAGEQETAAASLRQRKQLLAQRGVKG